MAQHSAPPCSLVRLLPMQNVVCRRQILRTMDGHGRKTKEGHAMRYMTSMLAVLLVAGALGVPGLYADAGGDYSEPPAVENDTIMLADAGGDRGGQPVDEQAGEIRTADAGGDRSRRPAEEADAIMLV